MLADYDPSVPPPKCKKSLLGAPPPFSRIVGRPKALSVFFCNQHGYPRKLRPQKQKKEPQNMKKKLVSPNLKKTVPCVPSHDDMTAVVNQIVEELLDLENFDAAPTEPSRDRTKPNDLPNDVSNISMNNFTITNVLGEPVLSPVSSPQQPQHLN